MMLLLPSSLSLPYLFSISFDFEQFHLILDNNLQNLDNFVVIVNVFKFDFVVVYAFS